VDEGAGRGLHEEQVREDLPLQVLNYLEPAQPVVIYELKSWECWKFWIGFIKIRDVFGKIPRVALLALLQLIEVKEVIGLFKLNLEAFLRLFYLFCDRPSFIDWTRIFLLCILNYGTLPR
jgi:hypothetical protein